MAAWLQREGYEINRKRVQRLYRRLGIEAVYPKPNTSKGDKSHTIFPYLLRGVSIVRPDQVWSTDITYIRLLSGFVYLVAIMDWYSRYVLDWEISTTLEVDFCIEALERTLTRGSCEISNTDQGSQFTTPRFTNILLKSGISVSMDGRGRALDNVFIERLWRTLKYSCIYPRERRSVLELVQDVGKYFKFYNEEKPHQSLNYRTPAEVYFG